MTTLTITLSDDQVMRLIEQMPAGSRTELFVRLASEEWPEWARLVREAEPQARRLAAERGLNWEMLSDEDRIALVDDLLHEGRA